MRPFAIETLEKPVPSPGTDQSFAGPAAGQLCKSPVSADTPFRDGPRNCGQLPPGGAALGVENAATIAMPASRIGALFFTSFIPLMSLSLIMMRSIRVRPPADRSVHIRSCHVLVDSFFTMPEQP